MSGSFSTKESLMECLEIHSHLVTLSSTLVFSQITYDWAQREVSGFHERVEAGEESEAEESAPMSGRKPPATAATTAPTTLVMEVEEVGGDLSSRMLDDLSARLLQERDGTVEEAHACTSGNDIENDKDIDSKSVLELSRKLTLAPQGTMSRATTRCALGYSFGTSACSVCTWTGMRGSTRVTCTLDSSSFLSCFFFTS